MQCLTNSGLTWIKFGRCTKLSKKKIQIAFAIVLVILSVVSTFIEDKIIYNIILAVIVPSFVLTIISFIDEIIERCEINSKALSESCFKFSEEQLDKAKQQALEAGEANPDFLKGFHATLDICKSMHQSGVGYSATKEFFEKCRAVLSNFSIVGYVLLFLSLIFSPYIVDWLSGINLNCLTLWSLTILYCNIELKPELAGKILSVIARRFLKKAKEKEQSETKE